MIAPGEAWEGNHDEVTLVKVDPKTLPRALHKFHGLFLLRPDRYVAAVLPSVTFASACEQLNQLVASTWNSHNKSEDPVEQIENEVVIKER
jgi:hypothetical protein